VTSKQAATGDQAKTDADSQAEGPGQTEPPAQAATPTGPQATAEAEVSAEPLAAEASTEAEVEAPAEAGTGAETSEPERQYPEPIGKREWYILKVQSNREDSIREALQRNIRIHGLDDFFGDIIVPVEMRTEFKSGKKRVVKQKLYPGYIVVNMELNDDTWYLVRDTHGIGDFTGSGGKPSPMLPHEVNRILAKQEEKTDEAPKLKISFNKGDRVKITEGTFENFEGEVDNIDEANGRVTVMINIFGRSTPVELEYWQLESL
jgi:transcriptional antiterminator NusG